jgi:hypothetical protein
MSYLKTLYKCWGIFLAAIGYGMIVSFLSINGARQPPIQVLDNTGYQNFAIMTGAITGFLVSLSTITYYYYLVKFNRANWYAFPLLLCVLSGILIGLLGSGIVNYSAHSFGLVNGSTVTVLFDGFVSALFGAGLGWFISIIVQEQI